MSAGGIDTYSGIVNACADWLVRQDLIDRIPDFIRLTELELQRDLDLREQEVEDDTVFVAGQDHFDLPTGHLWTRNIRLNKDPVRFISVVGLDKFNSVKAGSSNTGTPLVLTQVGKKLLLTPIPDVQIPITHVYMGEIEPLSDDNQTNEITRAAPDALLYGSLLHSAPYIGDDPRVAVWSSFYEKAKDSYRRMEWRSRTGGGPLRIRPDFSIDDRHDS